MLRSYIDGLYKHLEKVEKEREQLQAKRNQQVITDSFSRSTKPLEQQIVEFLRTQSPDQLKRPWTMDEFVMHLDGQWRDRPHPQQVGETLRKLGWQRRRCYSRQAASRRYWFPPA